MKMMTKHPHWKQPADIFFDDWQTIEFWGNESTTQGETTHNTPNGASPPTIPLLDCLLSNRSNIPTNPRLIDDPRSTTRHQNTQRCIARSDRAWRQFVRCHFPLTDHRSEPLVATIQREKREEKKSQAFFCFDHKIANPTKRHRKTIVHTFQATRPRWESAFSHCCSLFCPTSPAQLVHHPMKPVWTKRTFLAVKIWYKVAVKIYSFWRCAPYNFNAETKCSLSTTASRDSDRYRNHASVFEFGILGTSQIVYFIMGTVSM